MSTLYAVGAAVVILAAGLFLTLRFAVTADDRLADVRINIHPGPRLDPRRPDRRRGRRRGVDHSQLR